MQRQARPSPRWYLLYHEEEADCSGGRDGRGDRKVLEKRKSLLKWIGDNGGYINGYSLQGVVMAPNDFGGSPSFTTYVPNTNEKSAVEVVRGVDVRRILGGLDQIFVWFA